MERKRTLSTARVAFLMAALTGIAKVLGFLREMVLANYFGAGTVTDAYVMALSIPNSLLAALISAVGTVYTPAFSLKTEKEGDAAGDRFTSRVIDLQCIVIAVVIALGLLFARPLVRFFAPGYSAETTDLTVFYLRFALFTLFCSVLTYIFGAWLNYKGVFLPITVYSVCQNVFQILFVAVSAFIGYKTLILGPLFAMAGTALAHVLRAKKSGFVYTPLFRADDSVRDVLRQALPVFAGGYVNQINLAIDKILASGLQSGCVSALNYSNQIINSVSALTVMIFLTILYPKLSKAFVQEDFARVSELADRGIRLICVLSMPLSLGMVCYAEDAVRVLFERGAFDAQATKLTATALLWYATGLVFLSVNLLIAKVFYALRDSKTPVYCSAVSVLLNIVLNFILVKSMGHGGLALATGIAAAVNTLLLYLSFNRKHPAIRLLSSGKALLQMLLFSLLCVGGSRLLYGFLGSGLLTLVLCAALAVLAYLGLLFLFRFPETDLLKQLFGKRS